MPSVLVPIAHGSEELEAITVIDLLRRAEVEVTIASLDGKPVTCSRKTTIVPDCGIDDVLDREFDMIVLPGGLPGADHLDNDPRVHQLLKKMNAEQKFVTAICAAPRVLARAGVLTGKRATSYPGFLDNLGIDGVASTGGAVERDGNVITSRGPGTAMDFALALIDALKGAESRTEVETRLVRA